MSNIDETAFADAMLRTYHEALKLGYRATHFLRMVHELGAVQTAKRLIHDTSFSSGFTQLWELGRLGLSVRGPRASAAVAGAL